MYIKLTLSKLLNVFMADNKTMKLLINIMSQSYNKKYLQLRFFVWFKGLLR